MDDSSSHPLDSTHLLSTYLIHLHLNSTVTQLHSRPPVESVSKSPTISTLPVRKTVSSRVPPAFLERNPLARYLECERAQVSSKLSSVGSRISLPRFRREAPRPILSPFFSKPFYRWNESGSSGGSWFRAARDRFSMSGVRNRGLLPRAGKAPGGAARGPRELAN